MQRTRLLEIKYLLAKWTNYVETITDGLPNWIEEASDLSNNRVKWDWIKFKIKMNSITLSKKISRERQKLEDELNFKYQDALKRFQQNPSNLGNKTGN